MNLFTPVFQFVQNVADTVITRFFLSVDSFTAGEVPIETWLERSASQNDDEGYATAINADATVAVVSAPGTSTGQGRVKVWVKTNDVWSIQHTLAMSTSEYSTFDLYGEAVAISEDGNTIVVGGYNSRMNGSSGNRTGAFLIYEKNDITLPWSTSNSTRTRFAATWGADGDEFGWAVDVSGDAKTIVVSARKYAGTASDAGAVYIYEKVDGDSNNGWGSTYKAELTASTPTANDFFGDDVAVSYDGSTVVIGSTGADPLGSSYSNIGAVYVYEKGSSWQDGSSNQVKTLMHKSLVTGDSSIDFGSAVAISADGNTIVGCAKSAYDGRNASPLKTGAAFVHVRKEDGTWDAFGDAELIPENADHLANRFSFGFSKNVSISDTGRYIVVGSPKEDIQTVGGTSTTTYNNMGAAYVFEKPQAGWTSGTSYNDAALNEIVKILPANVGYNPGSPNADYDQFFGQGCDISGDGSTIIVGAPDANSPEYDTSQSTSEYFNIGTTHIYNHVDSTSNWGASITGLEGIGGGPIDTSHLNSICAVLDRSGNRLDDYLWQVDGISGGSSQYYINIKLFKASAETGEFVQVYNHRCYKESGLRWKPHDVCDTGDALIITYTETQYENCRYLFVPKMENEVFYLDVNLNVDDFAASSSFNYYPDAWNDFRSVIYDPVYNDLISAYAHPYSNFNSQTLINKFVRITSWPTSVASSQVNVTTGSSGLTDAIDGTNMWGVYIDRDPNTGYFLLSGTNGKARRYQRTGATSFVAIDEFDKDSSNLYQPIYKSDGTLYFRGGTTSGNDLNTTLYRH